MSQDPEFPGTHFSELLEDQYRVTNLARPGISTVEIAFQIKQSMELDCDYVIIGTTSPNRIELPINNSDRAVPLSLDHFRPGKQRRYISSNINTLVTQGYGFAAFEPYLTQHQVEAVKQYLTYIYDNDLKKEIDEWIIGYWLSRLNGHSVPYLVLDQTFPVYIYKNIQRPFYHTDFETQKIAAKWVNDYLNKIFKTQPGQ
jgi:hypothetical protein